MRYVLLLGALVLGLGGLPGCSNSPATTAGGQAMTAMTPDSPTKAGPGRLPKAK
jgi:hypothetical protein